MSVNYWINDAVDEYFYGDTVLEFDEEEIIAIIKNFQRMERETGLKVNITDHSQK